MQGREGLESRRQSASPETRESATGQSAALSLRHEGRRRGWDGGVVKNAVVQAPCGPPAQQRKEWAGRGTLQNSSPGAKQAFFLHTQEGFPKGNRHFPQSTPMCAEAKPHV